MEDSDNLYERFQLLFVIDKRLFLYIRRFTVFRYFAHIEHLIFNIACISLNIKKNTMLRIVQQTHYDNGKQRDFLEVTVLYFDLWPPEIISIIILYELNYT